MMMMMYGWMDVVMGEECEWVCGKNVEEGRIWKWENLVDAFVLKLAVAAGIVKINREAIGALAKVRKRNFAQSPGNQELRPL